MLFRDSDTQRRDTSYDNLSNIDIQYNFSRSSFLTIKLINDKVIHLGTSQESRDNKGQLISKCPYEKSVSSKIPTKIFLDFCPEIFCSFLGASW
jgi:hypothetical protein